MATSSCCSGGATSTGARRRRRPRLAGTRRAGRDGRAARDPPALPRRRDRRRGDGPAPAAVRDVRRPVRLLLPGRLGGRALLPAHLGLPLEGRPGRVAGRGVRDRTSVDEHPPRRPRGCGERPALPAPGGPRPVRRRARGADLRTGPTTASGALLAFEGRRAYAYYDQARPLAELVAPVGRPVLATIVGIYRTLLDEIARRDYDVLAERVALPSWRKVAITLRSLSGRFRGPVRSRARFLGARSERRRWHSPLLRPPARPGC